MYVLAILDMHPFFNLVPSKSNNFFYGINLSKKKQWLPRCCSRVRPPPQPPPQGG